jgi:chromosome segregation ATPase
VEAEKSASKYQQRIDELTQENERLVGEINLANEAFESLRTQSQSQPDAQVPALTEHLNAMSLENAALADWNSALQAKISELEESAKEARRLERELTSAQTALQQMSDELAKARKSTKLDMIAEELERALKSNPAGRGGELGRFEEALAEARGEWDKISDLHAKVEQLAVENHELRSAATKAIEEAAIVKRCLSDQTNEEFDQIRRALVAKRNEKPDKLSRFWPFKAAPRTT